MSDIHKIHQDNHDVIIWSLKGCSSKKLIFKVCFFGNNNRHNIFLASFEKVLLDLLIVKHGQAKLSNNPLPFTCNNINSSE